MWQIDIKHDKGATAFVVDASNGEVLAAKAEEDDDLYSWPRSSRPRVPSRKAGTNTDP